MAPPIQVDPQAENPLIALKFPKCPYPRQLTKKETMDSLSHWQSCMRNYFRRTPQYAQFFRRNAIWDPSKTNYGFQGDESDVQADDLECLLDTIASFMPGPYITHQITKMTINMQSVWDVIWNHYGVKPTQLTSLDFMSLKMESDDRYIDLYDKMIYHSTTHLCPAGTIDDTILAADKKLAQADNLTTSHKNLITLLWLNKINPKLIGIVKLEYTKDLKSGMPLCSLARTIADNVDSLLMRFADHKIQSVASTAPDAEQTQSQVLRFQNQPRFPGPRNNFRGRGQLR